MNRKKDIEQLFRQHYAKMYNLARCILSDDDESKDVVSEVFAQILADDVVLVPGSEDARFSTYDKAKAETISGFPWLFHC